MGSLHPVPVAPVCYISTEVFVPPTPAARARHWCGRKLLFSVQQNEWPSQCYGYRHHPTHFSTAGSSRNVQELTYYFPFFSHSYSTIRRADAKAAVLPYSNALIIVLLKERPPLDFLTPGLSNNTLYPHTHDEKD